MLDTKLIVIETYATAHPPAPPKPRVRFRDYRCVHCARLLMRSSLDNIAMSLPQDFERTHPLLMTALRAVVCEVRCPKCGVTNTYKPLHE
jgi:phage FluMu protein Com